MAAATIKMVTDSIDAFVKNDVELVKSVIAYDDVVDGHFNRVKKQLIRYLGKPEADGEYALDLLMIAKYLERIGDHATNIAEWVLPPFCEISCTKKRRDYPLGTWLSFVAMFRRRSSTFCIT